MKPTVRCLKIASAKIALGVSGAIFLFLARPAQTADQLSRGPLVLSAKQIAAARAAYKHGLIYTDQDCYLTPEVIAATELKVAELPAEVCKGRTQELLYLASKSALVACTRGRPDFAMLVSIGSNGIGKTAAGNRKSPVGTYWLGYPRHSMLFGIFIPLGYPNVSDLAKGYTGDSVGIHGPFRFMTCHPEKSLEKNWTAGCFAVGRDSQLIQISEWIFAHWPARLTISRD